MESYGFLLFPIKVPLKLIEVFRVTGVPSGISKPSPRGLER